MSEYPDFVIVCDHGIGGDDAEPELVWRYRWDDGQGVWTPEGDGVSPPGVEAVVYGGGAVTVTFMSGDRAGWFHADKADNEPLREHHEIKCLCLKPRCGRRFRIPAEDLQMVFATISIPSTRESLRALAPSVADGNSVPVSLTALQGIRDHVDSLGAMPHRD